MSARAADIMTQLEATVATATGLSSAKVARGSPTTLQGRPQMTPPCAYLWVRSLSSARGPASRKYTVRLTVGWYVASAATAGTVRSMEAAALDLVALVAAAVLGDPATGGYAHDVESWEIEANGTLPGTAESDVPACWMAGSFVVRYDTTGAL